MTAINISDFWQGYMDHPAFVLYLEYKEYSSALSAIRDMIRKECHAKPEKEASWIGNL